MSRRCGFQLLELVVALGVIAGPVCIGLHLSTSAVLQARQVHRHMTVRAMTRDLLELVVARDPRERAALTGPAGAGALADLARRRYDVRDQDYGPVGMLAATRFELEVRDPGVPGLTHLRLTSRHAGSVFVVNRLARDQR